jgi:hypothetical protein
MGVPMCVRALAVAVGLVVSTGSLTAQSVAGMRAGVTLRMVPDSDSTVSHELIQSPSSKRAALRPYAGLASLVVPGSGQFILGKDRFVGFLAVEVLGWWQYSKDVRERASQERAYKDYARRIAREPFLSTLPAPIVIPDGNWEYYEWMRDFIESGPFSLSVVGPTRPDTNPDTFNGNRWKILKSTQATEEAALAAYEQQAIRPEYRWSWTNRQLQYDIYVRTTDLRNDAARAAVKDLLVIGANHFLSMIDAFASFRLQVRAENARVTSVGATMRW